MPSCNDCGEYFEEYQELAHHIIKAKHRHGKKWANNYLLKHVLFEKEMPQRTALTAEQKQSKEDAKRGLSGDMRYASTICPKCKRKGRPLLPSEFVDSPVVWRINGLIAKFCIECGGIA
jgi:hypothetical protein